MRFVFLLMIFATSLLHSQVSNIRQTVDNGRIIISYDLLGSDEYVYNIRITATNDNDVMITPAAVAGDLSKISPSQGRSIWWEPALEGLTSKGWEISLNAKEDIGITWVLVKGGPIGDFYISATEVTFYQHDQFYEATGYQKPKANFGREKQPVVNVNVADAVAFCDWQSKETGTIVRLPEENEWEYAARGGKKNNNYEYSGSNTIDEVAWDQNNSDGKTHEVGIKKPNELGIYDMSGNVWEWCGTSGAVRGSSWNNNYYGVSVRNCRISDRAVFPIDYRSYGCGFRILQKK